MIYLPTRTPPTNTRPYWRVLFSRLGEQKQCSVWHETEARRVQYALASQGYVVSLEYVQP